MVNNAEGKRDDIQQEECESGADSDIRLESRWKRETARDNDLEKSRRFDIRKEFKYLTGLRDFESKLNDTFQFECPTIKIRFVGTRGYHCKIR
jgi:acyl-CoA-binding protein